MKIRKRHNKLFIAVVAAAVFVFSLFTISIGVAQEGSQIGAFLCHTDGPDLQITQPLSDSVVNTPSVVIAGTALRTSQIDFTVNGQYSHSVAIGLDAALQTQVPLRPGTNTIGLQAFFSCNGTSASRSIIVDYQPIVSPTDPNAVDTQVVNAGDSTATTSNAGSLDTIKDKFGLSGVSSSYAESVLSWITLLIIAVLLALAFGPVSLVTWVGSRLGVSTVATKKARRLVRFLIILLVFVLLVSLATL